MAPARLPSLDVILVALARPEQGWPGAGGVALAVSSGLLAIWSFLPREFPMLETAAIRHHYLRAEAGFTKLHLLDAQIEMAREMSISLRRKAGRLKVASACLGAAVILAATELLVA